MQEKKKASKTVSISQRDKEFSIYKKRQGCDKKKKIIRRKGYFKICCRNKNTTRLEDKGGDIRIK